MAKMKAAPLPRSKAKTAYGLLSEVRALILDEPRRYNQFATLMRVSAAEIRANPDYPSCGTIGCVAGWVTMLKAKGSSRLALAMPLTTAERILGLQGGQPIELFNCGAAGSYQDPKSHAEAGAEHIRRFQQKYKRQLQAKAV